MEMRSLSAADLFPLLNIMTKIGIKDVIKNFYKQRAESVKRAKEAVENKEEIDIEDVGVNAVAELTEFVLGNIGRAKNEINTMLASMCSVPRKEIEDLPLSEYMGLVMDFLSQEELKASLKVIMQSFK